MKLETLWEEAFGRKPQTMQEKMFLNAVRKHIIEQEDFTLSRLEDWLKNPEPAQTKFTAGKLRNIARLIEDQRIKPITEEQNEKVLALHMIGDRLVDFDVGTIIDCKKAAEELDPSEPDDGSREGHLPLWWIEFGMQFAVMPEDKPPFGVTHYIPIYNDDKEELPF